MPGTLSACLKSVIFKKINHWFWRRAETVPRPCCLLSLLVNCDLTVVFARLVQNWYSYQYTCLQVIEYIKVKQGFTGLLLTHIATSAVMDLLLRLITCVEGTENKQNILTVNKSLLAFSPNSCHVQWLNEEQLIQRVVALLAPPAIVDGGGGNKAEVEEKEEGEATSDSPPTPPPVVYSALEAHDNAGQLLVEIIRVSRYFVMDSAN